jgi:hypothetical protein
MKRMLLALLLANAATGLRAQTPLLPDTGDAAEVQDLQRQIRQRWNARVRQDLQLSDEQAAKLQGTETKYLQQRRDVAQRQRAINEALRGELQPGVVASGDSVRKLLDARDRNRAALAQIDRDENQEIARYLSPVQHARYQMMREQLRQRIQQLRQERRGGARAGTIRPRGARRRWPGP